MARLASISAGKEGKREATSISNTFLDGAQQANEGLTKKPGRTAAQSDPPSCAEAETAATHAGLGPEERENELRKVGPPPVPGRMNTRHVTAPSVTSFFRLTLRSPENKMRLPRPI